MSETAKSVTSITVLLVGLPVLILWARDRILHARWRRRNPLEELAAERRAYQQRVLRPDWSFYERHLGPPAPPALCALYADRTFVTLQDLSYNKADRISTFDALDEKGLWATRPWLGFETVAIASTDFGDVIHLRPGAAEPDTVYITRHNGGDIEVFADSVAAMVEKIRRANDSA
jgi:hypothetical protein